MTVTVGNHARSGRQNRFLPIKAPDDLQAAREEIVEMYDGGEAG